MNFKNIKYVALAFAAVAMTACDEKDADERYTYVPPVTAERGVLLEDFTGQACVNCPNATEEIHELQEHYGDKVVAVGIHSGQFSKKPPRYKNPYPLWTSVGDEYFNHWNISSQPKGIINRNGGEMVYQSWASTVEQSLQEKAPMSIEVTNKYDESTNTLKISTRLTALPGNTVDGKLQLWLIQDGIVGTQYFTGNVIDKEYVHNHVFRFAANGTWGEDIKLADSESKVVEKTVDLSAKLTELREENKSTPDFVPSDMSVVAFVYNSYGVQNVVQVAVVPKQASNN